MISISQLTYHYPQQPEAALQNISLRTQEPLTRVLGPSGAGKSTLLRIACGLVPHFHGGRISGRATVAGIDVFKSSPRQLAGHVGFLFQDPELQSVRPTAAEDVAFGLENRGLRSAEMNARVDEALELTATTHLRRRRISSLSGGERQRIALAGLLALRPPILALDEPVSQLDAEGERDFAVACRALMQRGTMVLLAEHGDLLQLGAGAISVNLHQGALQEGAAEVKSRDSKMRVRPLDADTGEEVWSLCDASVGPAKEPLIDAANICGRRGEVIALCGRNGSGKTTLLRILAGFIAPLAGSVSRHPQARFAYLPQNPAALLHLASVDAEVQLTLRHAGLRHDPDDLCRSLGLDIHRRRFPGDLSSGQRQRAALAAVLAGRPDVVLLDEPTRGMDASTATALVQLIQSLQARGSCIVIATHDRQLVRAVANRTFEIRDRRLQPLPSEPES